VQNCKSSLYRQRQGCNACEKLAEKAAVCPASAGGNLSASEGLLTFLIIYVNTMF